MRVGERSAGAATRPRVPGSMEHPLLYERVVGIVGIYGLAVRAAARRQTFVHASTKTRIVQSTGDGLLNNCGAISSVNCLVVIPMKDDGRHAMLGVPA